MYPMLEIGLILTVHGIAGPVRPTEMEAVHSRSEAAEVARHLPGPSSGRTHFFHRLVSRGRIKIAQQ